MRWRHQCRSRELSTPDSRQVRSAPPAAPHRTCRADREREPCCSRVTRYLPFSLEQLAVPFASRYRPLPTALGIVAMELLVAVAITNLLRQRLPYRAWRRIHYATLL